MPPHLETLIDLLHASGEAALATHSQTMPGYPFATAVPFATDEHHRPIFLLSRLAEHTQNLLADNRASFLVARSLGQGEMARHTLVGHVLPIGRPPPGDGSRALRVRRACGVAGPTRSTLEK